MDDIIFFILLGISLVIFIVCVIIYLKGMNSIYSDLNFLKDCETIKSLEEKFENRLFDKNIKVEKVNAEEQIEELKKELAEKENKIEKLNKNIINLIEHEQQDKFLFCIEKLEELKEFCENWKCYTELINYVIVEEKSGIRCVPTLYEEIDNQIKQLKEKL